MKLVNTFFLVHLFIAVAALAVAFALGGSIVLALVVILTGGFWAYANQRDVHGLEFLILMALTMACVALFFWFSAPIWLPLVAMIAALGAWDLDYFLQRLKVASHDGISPRLGIEHLKRLGIAEGLGLLLGIVGMTMRAQISFWVAVGLALVTAIGLSQLVRYLRKQLR